MCIFAPSYILVTVQAKQVEDGVELVHIILI